MCSSACSELSPSPTSATSLFAGYLADLVHVQFTCDHRVPERDDNNRDPFQAFLERAATPGPEFPWRMADAKKLGLGANRAGTTIYSLSIRDASAK